MTVYYHMHVVVCVNGCAPNVWAKYGDVNLKYVLVGRAYLSYYIVILKRLSATRRAKWGLISALKCMCR